MTSTGAFTPALGKAWLTPLYDFAVATLTRERVWRNLLVRQVAPGPDDRILDVGCGTGSLVILLKETEPQARVIGLDPDTGILERAQEKSVGPGQSHSTGQYGEMCANPHNCGLAVTSLG